MKANRRLPGIGPLLGLVSGACVPSEPDPSRSARVDAVAGVVRVWNPAPATVGRADSLFSIGAVVGDGPDAFGRVVSVVSHRDGRIYVADEIANRVQVFDAAGRFERSLGREGEGPGEFNRLYSLAWLGDTLAALDVRNARVELLTPDGASAGTFRHQPLSGDRRNVRLFQTGRHEIATVAVRVEDGRLARKIIRFAPSGPTDSVPYPDAPWRSDDPTAGGTTIVCEYPAEAGLEFFAVPFAARHWAVPAPGGTSAVVWTADYRVVLLDDAGDTVRVVERDYERVPTSEEEWQEGLSSYRERLAENPGLDCQNGNPERPAFRPALHLLFFDSQGRMWIEWESAAGPALDVYDSEGRLLGSIAAPRRIADLVPWADARRLYTVATDDLGVQYVNVYGLDQVERMETGGR